jgi:Zn/Cd-binding protein ZinT
MRRNGFAILTFMLCLFILDCKNESSDDPQLAKWAGTWNAVTNDINESWMDQTFADGAAYILATHGKAISDSDLRDFFSEMLGTDFASSVIADDTFTTYTEADAAGTATKITYTFKQRFAADEDDGKIAYWYAFEGDRADDSQYLIALLPEQDSPDTMEHFHFRYGTDGFDALMDEEMGMWFATFMKQGTTQDQLAASLTMVIEELPWDQILP